MRPFREWEIGSWKVGKVVREWEDPAFWFARWRFLNGIKKGVSLMTHAHNAMNIVTEGVRAHAYTIAHVLVVYLMLKFVGLFL